MIAMSLRNLQYKLDRWMSKRVGGHKNIGRLTIYGHNAMHFAVNYRSSRWGYICFRPPSITPMGHKLGWYFYLSPNGTPWASTYAVGPGVAREEKLGAVLRRQKYGHNFDSRILHPDIHPEVLELYPQYFDADA